MTEQHAQTLSQELLNKYELLKSYLRSLESAAIAFSGGVDSAFLLYAAREALPDRVTALTVAAGSFPQRESREAEELCRALQVPQRVVCMDVMEIEGFAENPANRCYICKKALFERLWEMTREEERACLIEGSNLDDEGDYRPGLAAIRELEVISPLRTCGLTKAEIRELSRYAGLPTWKKPSYACLASRIPYGERITAEKLSMVEQGEAYLQKLGFTQFRVRIHDRLARIELLPGEMERIWQQGLQQQIASAFRDMGFAYTALDLEGYRTGSMNELLSGEEKKKHQQ